MGTFILGAAIGLFFGWAHAHKHIAAECERLREALEDILSRSSINLAMRPDPFALTAALGDIHQIAAPAPVASAAGVERVAQVIHDAEKASFIRNGIWTHCLHYGDGSKPTRD